MKEKIMKTHQRTLLLSLAIGALLAAGSLLAVPPGPIPFSSYDGNGDGRVSADEFYAARNARIGERAREGRLMRNLGNVPAFEAFDDDRDGYLSENELLKGQLSQMRQRQLNRPMAPMGGADRQPGGAAGFADFDSNDDGVVTAEEFARTRADRQGEKAAQGYPMRNAGSAPGFESFDANGDGRLTPEEFVPGRRF
jgi:Ca2+-binding EF-hand superfamily protein